MEFITLSNGVKMPALGYVTFTMSNEETERCVLEAIKTGYRLIDTAQAYYNEEGVGNAIIKCGVPREELFITTKIWIENAGYEKAKASLHESLKKLQIEYIDLVLIHQAFNDYYGTWKALEEAYKLGKVRAIGVSNFYLDRFMDLATFSEIKPMVNQLETHVFQQHKNDKKFLERYGTKLEAWAPFARGCQGIFENEVLMKIAKQHNKTIGQVALRFLIQNGIIAIPKSTHKNRMEENFNIFDFSLSDEEMKKMKEYKEDLLEIHPIFQMLEDDRVERRQEKPFLELFKEFYKEERGIQPSKEMIEMLEEIIGRENRDETSSIDNTRIE